MKLSENSEEEAWGSQEWTKLAVTSAIAGIAGGLEQTCHDKLMTAVEKEDKDSVKMLLDADSCVENLIIQDKSGQTALMYAVVNGHEDIVRVLLDDDLTKQDQNGNTALILAVANGHEGIVRVLLEYD